MEGIDIEAIIGKHKAMGRKGRGPQEISTILQKSDAMPLAEICREYGLSERTLYRWRADRKWQNTATTVDLRQIEDENAKLKSLVAELILENRALKEGLNRTRKISSIR